ncbi:AAEL005948-PA [Aedes aegypti]|uniref:AAEL005948-PA n=1 Tax=Aedes aegypti TaxID=7159 RepID=Q178D4_AEDAE|nr:AAEL005948-PA [Aedes aegypti]
MTASKISRPNSFLGSSAATPRNSSFDNYRSQVPQNVNRTKRCLFGMPDSNETKRLYNESVQQDRQRFIQRYNFDTVADLPSIASQRLYFKGYGAAATEVFHRATVRRIRFFHQPPTPDFSAAETQPVAILDQRNSFTWNHFNQS